MRYFLEIAYNGSNFHGWQRQPNAIGVQQVIEEALSIILRTPTAITGAGRTDAGVHARKMYAHFDAGALPQDPSKFILSLNRLTGREICIRDLYKVNEEAHARFDATERSYKYFVRFSQNPFMSYYSWLSPTQLNLESMNKAAQKLIETEDFTSFAKLHSDSKTNLCDVREAIWKPIAEDPDALSFLGTMSDGIVFTIRADRFLRNMVRAVVGTLADVGRGKLSPEDFGKVISQKDRCSAGVSMPAEGLFLWDIKYPFSMKSLLRE